MVCVVVIVLVIFVIVSSPGEITDSTKLKDCPGVVIFHLGVDWMSGACH